MSSLHKSPSGTKNNNSYSTEREKKKEKERQKFMNHEFIDAYIQSSSVIEL
jgi:hypothetical protein